MLTEEGHHMFVGRTGVERTVQRTCEVMKAAAISDPGAIGAVRALGVIDLPTIQKKINFHYSVTLDLFGSEISTNAANAFNASLKGRFRETTIDDDHRLHDAVYPVLQYLDGRFEIADAPALSAINARLCDAYIADCESVLKMWNRAIEQSGIDYRLSLPHRAFHRAVGEFAGLHVSADGKVMSGNEWNTRQGEWLPSDSDLEYILSLMKPVRTPGEFAGWIAPPKIGIDGKAGDFEYVKLAA
ncbi:MAG: benzoyl-CoA 2,3-epoxidase subunit BoxB, partial [Gammaproteobacteria bacterium]